MGQSSTQGAMMPRVVKAATKKLLSFSGRVGRRQSRAFTALAAAM